MLCEKAKDIKHDIDNLLLKEIFLRWSPWHDADDKFQVEADRRIEEYRLHMHKLQCGDCRSEEFNKMD